MYIHRIVVVLVSFFCYCKGELISFSNKYKTQITSNDTYLATVTVPSSIVCARECTRDDCCTACYDKTIHKCHLNRDCFPVTEHSDSGVLLKKNDVETINIATEPDKSSGSTTLEQISTTGIPTTTNDKTTYKESEDLSTTTTAPTLRDITINFKTTSDKGSTVTTIESTTENETLAIINYCSDIPIDSRSGVYTKNVDNQPVEVYCEMRVDGQWTVIQKRLDGTTDFY